MAMGIDEAGRGPVIGPLIVCALYSQDPEYLTGLGVKDSKCLDRSKRNGIASILEINTSTAVLSIPARAIDSARESMTLNDLEVLAFASAACSLMDGRPLLHGSMPEGCGIEYRGRAPPCSVLMDAADVDEGRFTRRVREACSDMLDVEAFEFTGKHRADSLFPEVSAASIVAKVRRDREIMTISAEIGSDVGSGYPSDPVTIAFLNEHMKVNRELPPHTRRTWETARSMLSLIKNSTLGDFPSEQP